MIKVHLFVNQLMTSNCYVIVQDGCANCVIVDPGSKKSVDVIEFIENNNLYPEFIILTHEHTDHTWGCGYLKQKYNSKIVCSELCKDLFPKIVNAYFQYYYDNSEYNYECPEVDIILEKIDYELKWCDINIKFIKTPGHSLGSVCFSIENYLFTGDTIMPFKSYIHKRSGGSIEEYKKSINNIYRLYNSEKTMVYPGHGNTFLLKDFEYKMSDD